MIEFSQGLHGHLELWSFASYIRNSILSFLYTILGFLHLIVDMVSEPKTLLDNGDDFRKGRRGYCVEVRGGSTPGMMTLASDGGDSEKSLWL